MSDILLIPLILNRLLMHSRKGQHEQTTAIGKTLQQWLRCNVAKQQISPLQWLKRVLSKWVTIAQVSGENTVHYRIPECKQPSHGCKELWCTWTPYNFVSWMGMSCALDAILSNYHTIIIILISSPTFGSSLPLSFVVIFLYCFRPVIFDFYNSSLVSPF